MKNLWFAVIVLFAAEISGQNLTDASLFLKNDNVQLDSIGSLSGDLYSKLGHHGPAVENQWLGLRLYFDKKTAIDVYSKTRPGLEIRKKLWYPSKEEQLAGWGADYYKVGKSLGLGGIRLWDGQSLVMLDPVSKRTATVKSDGDSSYMEMLSEGVSYLNKKVDILIRVSVFSDRREAKVEAFSLTGEPVQFATGINYFKGFKTESHSNYIATWGLHPEDVAAEPVELGAAILFDKKDFEKQMDDGDQFLLISFPATSIETWITSANAKESEINNFERFIREIKNLEVK